MFSVTTIVPKVDFAMLDDRVVPVGNVQRSVRPHASINRPKRDVLGRDDLGLLAADVSAAAWFECEAADAVAAKIIRNEITRPLRRNVGARENLDAAMFRAAGVHPLEPPRGARRRDKDGIGKHIVDALEVGTVGRKRFTDVIKNVTPRIDESFAYNFQLAG